MRRLILIEGAQGVGKTTTTNLLREKIPYSNLFRLSGIKDKEGPIARDKIVSWYYSLAPTILQGLQSDFDIILDRYMTTEYVYRQLGYGGVGITWQLQNTLKIFEDAAIRQEMSGEEPMKFYFILLEASEEEFGKRLASRGNKVQHAGIQFEVENSLKQQKAFEVLWTTLSPTFKREILLVNNKSPEEVVEEILHMI